VAVLRIFIGRAAQEFAAALRLVLTLRTPPVRQDKPYEDETPPTARLPARVSMTAHPCISGQPRQHGSLHGYNLSWRAMLPALSVEYERRMTTQRNDGNLRSKHCTRPQPSCPEPRGDAEQAI